MQKKPPRAPRYGDYLVTRAWATRAAHPQPPTEPKPAAGRWRTLWASRPLELPHARALAVRRRGDEVEVGVVDAATRVFRWKPAHQVLAPPQAAAWARKGGFKP